jgi:hypothetical protein
MYLTLLLTKDTPSFIVTKELSASFWHDEICFERVNGFTGLFYSLITSESDSGDVIRKIQYTFIFGNTLFIEVLRGLNYVEFLGFVTRDGATEIILNLYNDAIDDSLQNLNKYLEIFADSITYFSEQQSLFGLTFFIPDGINITPLLYSA